MIALAGAVNIGEGRRRFFRLVRQETSLKSIVIATSFLPILLVPLPAMAQQAAAVESPNSPRAAATGGEAPAAANVEVLPSESSTPPAPVDATPPPAPKESLRGASAYEVPAESPDGTGRAANSAAPPPSRGFQLALRAAYARPLGNVDGSSPMSDTFSSQANFTVDIGGKPDPHWFLGAYLGLGIGSEGDAFTDACKQLSCGSATFRLGVQFQYNISPGNEFNPWFGYGIGIESSAVAFSGNGGDASVAAAGWEFGHFMGGFDWRTTKTFGIGPFIDFSVGQYTTATSEDVNGTKRTQDLADTSLHEWLQLGVRGVFFP
jgi:hypothetical protein